MNLDLTAIITWIIFGAIVGIIARFLMPGRDSMGWIPTIVLAIYRYTQGRRVTV